MNLSEWNRFQIDVIKKEALSKENRYFFWLKNGREAFNNAELELYYVLNGGALKWLREHEEELEYEEHKNERDDI